MNSGYQFPQGYPPPGVQPPQVAPPQVMGLSPGLPAQSVTTAQSAGRGPKVPDERINVGPFTLSFPHLFVPRISGKNPKPGDKPKFSAELIVFASDPLYPQLWTVMMTHAKNCYQKSGPVPGYWPSSPPYSTSAVPPIPGCPVKDLYSRPNYNGPPGFFISTNSVDQPSAYCGDPVRDATSADLYAGAVVHVNLTPKFYNVDSSVGLKFYLNTVLKVADGPRLAASRDGSEDVKAMMAGGVRVQESAPQAPAPPQYGIPSGIPAQYQVPQYQQPQQPQYQQPQQPQPSAPVVPQGYAPQYPPQQGYPQPGPPQMPGMPPYQG